MTERVMPTWSAIREATSFPSFPSSSLKMWMMASCSDTERVWRADFTTWLLRTSSDFSSLTERSISRPTTVVPYSARMMSSMS